MMSSTVSFLNNIREPANFSELDLSTSLELIKGDTYKQRIIKLRSVSLTDKDAYKKAKIALPSIHFNGRFKDSITNDNFIESSGLFHFDIDGLNPVHIEEEKAEVASIPSCVFCFVSPGGNGLKGALRIDAELVKNDVDFKNVYSFMEAFFKNFGHTIDAACKDVRRACFVSYDANLYVNYDAEILPIETVRVAENVSVSSADSAGVSSNNQWCLDSIVKLMVKARNGDKHGCRLRAAQLAGGYIAGGVLDEAEARAELQNISDRVSATGKTSKSEQKTLEDGIAYGKTKPIYGVDKKISKCAVSNVTPVDNIEKEEEEEKPEAQEWIIDLTGKIDYLIPAHFGVAADIQRWILRTSVKPQPVAAFAATLAIMSMVVGRHIHCDGIKGNFYSICIADSTEGKDRPYKAVREVLGKLDLTVKVHSEVASGVALVDILEPHPDSILLIDEIGHYLSAIKGGGANPHLKEVLPIITQLYTSGHDGYQEKAKKGIVGRFIKEPNLSVVGMTTERQIMDSMRTSELADGSISRFGVFFGNSNVRINVDALDMDDKEVPDDIIDRLEALRLSVGFSKFTQFERSKKLALSDEYKALKKKLVVYFNDKGIDMSLNGGSKAIFKPFYGRMAVMAVQFALLIDCCENTEVLEWTANLLEQNIGVFIKKFLHGAAENENERLVKIIERAIKEAGKHGITANRLYDATKQVQPNQKKLMIQDLIESGKVFTDFVKIDGSRKSSLVYFWRK